MMIQTMGGMMEAMSAPSVRFINPPKPGKSGGPSAAVYEQMRRDFMVASPFVLHGSVPDLLAAAWSVVRETLFCGDATRGDKEIVAWAVSDANQCPFCVGAHHAAVRASGANDAALEEWARSTNTSNVIALPMSENSVEFYGTAVAFHYLNRMVSVFLPDKMMPMPDLMDGMTNRMASAMMGEMIKKGQQNQPGDSATVRPDFDESLAWSPAWADSEPHIRDALRSWSGLVEGAALRHLDAKLLAHLGKSIDTWNGSTDDEMIEATVKAASNPGAAQLALSTVVKPWQVSAEMVQQARASGLSEDGVLVLVSWAAQRAARRVGEWIAQSPLARPALPM